MRFKRETDLSLSDARVRMRNLLASESRPYIPPADVSTTCVEPGTIPIRVIPPVRAIPQAKSNSNLNRPSQSAELTESDIITRDDIIDSLTHLQSKSISISEPELALAIQCCLRLVTEGRLTLTKLSNPEVQIEIPDWTM